MAHAVRALGLRPHDGCSVFDELFDFFEGCRGNGPAIGKDEHAVFHAAGQHENAVAHHHLPDQDFLVHVVVIMRLAEGGQVDRLRSSTVQALVLCPAWFDGGGDAPGGHQVGGIVAVVGADVGHEPALLQQMTTAREGVEQRSGLLPPGQVDVEVFAGVIGVSGKARIRRVVGEGMEGDLVEPGTEGDVGETFIHLRSILPVLPAGHRLRVDQWFAVEIGGAGGLLDAPILAVVPEFTHRDVGRPSALSVSKRAWPP